MTLASASIIEQNHHKGHLIVLYDYILSHQQHLFEDEAPEMEVMVHATPKGSITVPACTPVHTHASSITSPTFLAPAFIALAKAPTTSSVSILKKIPFSISANFLKTYVVRFYVG